MLISRIRILPALAALVLGLALTGCAAADEDQTAGADTLSSTPATPQSPSEEDSDGTGPTETPVPSETAPAPTEKAPTAPTLAVTIAGDEVSPNAESIELKVGEPLVLTFDSDRAGELHVHSKPEQYVDFEAGTSRQEIVIRTPGEVEIEDHETADVLAIVEVR